MQAGKRQNGNKPKSGPPTAGTRPGSGQPPALPRSSTTGALTRSGSPRQRGERQYYGATPDNRVLTFADYAEREGAVANGEVRRIGAHEARFLTAKRSAGAYATRTELIRTPTGAELAARTTASPSVTATLSTEGGDTVQRAKLMQVVALLDMAVSNISQIQGILKDLAGK